MLQGSQQIKKGKTLNCDKVQCKGWAVLLDLCYVATNTAQTGWVCSQMGCQGSCPCSCCTNDKCLPNKYKYRQIYASSSKCYLPRCLHCTIEFIVQRITSLVDCHLTPLSQKCIVRHPTVPCIPFQKKYSSILTLKVSRKVTARQGRSTGKGTNMNGERAHKQPKLKTHNSLPRYSYVTYFTQPLHACCVATGPAAPLAQLFP